MSEELLSLKQVARILGVSEQRVYQLDDELKPVLVPRGQKMHTRYYKPSEVQRALITRGGRQKPRDERELDQLAAEHSAKWLRMVAEHEQVSFGDLTEADAAAVRERMLKLASKIERGRA